MRKDKVNRILSKIVERTSFGNNIPEERVIVFNMRLPSKEGSGCFATLKVFYESDI